MAEEVASNLEKLKVEDEVEKPSEKRKIDEEEAESERIDGSDKERIEECEDGYETPGEGEEKDEKELDDDEIEENPAYIPKTGRFYMHDSRNEEEESIKESKPSRADGQWNHDRFHEKWQKPRSRKQLIDKYGFDIRYGESKEEAEKREGEMKEEGLEVEDDERKYEGSTRMRRPRGGYRPHNSGIQSHREDYQQRYNNRDNGAREQELLEDDKPAQRRVTSHSSYREQKDAPHYRRTFSNTNRRQERTDESAGERKNKKYSQQRASRGHHSDTVYFDASQQHRDTANPLPLREKKVLDIVAPSQ